MPASHPNITALLQNPAANPLGPFHPAIDPWIGNRTQPSYSPDRVTVRYWHPPVTVPYNLGHPVPATHPYVHDMLADVMPTNHPNLTTLLANPAANPIPAWHPPIEPWVRYLPQPSYTPFR